MNFFKKNKKRFVIIFVFISIVLALVSFNRISPSIFEKTIGVVITPIQDGISKVSSWIGDKISFAGSDGDIKEENEQLKLEIQLKDQEIARLKQVEIENEKLTGLLETASKHEEYETVTADIIGKDNWNWYETFTINKGSKDGIEKNMVVLSAGGLVGKVEEVGLNYAKVSSIISGSYSVSGKSLRTDDEGFVTGDLYNKGACKMEYIDKDAEIKEGDEIITSHLSDIYPQGIAIGTVKEIALDENTKVSKTAEIEPAVDFKHLERVLVITNY